MHSLLITAVCNLIVSGVAIILNIIGIYGLSNIKRNRTFQRLILINLSIGEVLICAIAYPYFVLVSIGNDPDSYSTKMLFRIATSIRFPLYLLMIVLTTDRLIACKMTISYRDIITRRLAIVAIVFSWATGIIVCIADQLFGSSVTERYSRIAFIVIDSLFLCLVTITYIFILKKILQHKDLVNDDSGKGHFNKRKTKFLRVSSSIILSFVLLVALPDIGLAIAQENFKHLNFQIELAHKCVTGLYLLVLPAIYIFANTEIHRFLLQKFCLKKTDNTESRSQSNRVERRKGQLFALN